jgi:hypothetical protein
MNKNRNSKRKIILALIVAVIAILLFWLMLKFVFDRTELGDQFGDSGEWGEEDEQISLTFGDTEYVSDDNIDTYLIIGTDGGGEFVDEEHSGTLADFLALMIIDNTTKKFGIIQIDRNSMMPMTDIIGLDEIGGEEVRQQICLAHWYGENEGQRNDNTVMAVSELFGYLDIDNILAMIYLSVGQPLALLVCLTRELVDVRYEGALEGAAQDGLLVPDEGLDTLLLEEVDDAGTQIDYLFVDIIHHLSHPLPDVQLLLFTEISQQ